MHSKVGQSQTLVMLIQSVAFTAILLLYQATSLAGTKFTSSYPCQDMGKSCVSTGVKTIDGFQVYKDCWEFAYEKTCNYPSKNDCSKYSHCYLVAFRDCLLKDTLGNCVNQLKEYSCKRWTPNSISKEKVRYGREERQGVENLYCKGMPCPDGNCVDKSYDSNNEMMDSVSRLYAVSEMKGVVDMKMELFPGYASHCTKKPAEYSNCCKLDSGANNWGHNLGAKCTKDEQALIDTRKKNLCAYVGKENKKTLGVTTLTKHHWCCFGNMLNKIIQVEGRKQLGLTFGSPGSADCKGLSLEQLLKLDFDKMDFTELEAELLKKMKLPKDGDLEARIKNSMPNMQKPESARTASANRRDGINANIIDDSWEAEEEKRFEEERIKAIKEEEVRLAELKKQQEEARLVQIKLEEERKRKEAQAAEAKRQRRFVKENQLKAAQAKMDNDWKTYTSWRASLPIPSNVVSFVGSYQIYIPEYTRLIDLWKNSQAEYNRIAAELKNGNY